MESLMEKYNKKIRFDLKSDLGLKNVHLVPCLEKVVVNTGIGRLSQSSNFADKILPEIIKEISLICGQKPVVCKAKKSIAGFKLREGQIIGLKATLRGKRMYDFVEKLIKVALPRVRDFRGVYLKNVDSKGNLNLGFREHVVFPEIDQDVSWVDFGLQVTLVVNARKREEAIELYKRLGFVFKK